MDNVKKLIDVWERYAKESAVDLESKYCGDTAAFVESKKNAQLDICLTALKLAYLKDGGKF